MKVTILQKDIVWCNPQENRDRAEEMMHDCSNTDLFVLPEMFTTGFCMQPKNIAETINGKTLQWMKHIAAEMSCAIAGSFAVQDNGKYYNRFYFVNPDGSHTHYDKSHLFTYGGDSPYYNIFVTPVKKINKIYNITASLFEIKFINLRIYFLKLK